MACVGKTSRTGSCLSARRLSPLRWTVPTPPPRPGAFAEIGSHFRRNAPGAMRTNVVPERRSLLVRSVEEETTADASIIPPLTEEREIDYLRAVFLFLVPALGGVLFGYDIGATSGAIDSLKDAVKSGTDWWTRPEYDLTSFQEGLVVSSPLLGAMVASVLLGFYGNKLGRRTELLAASVLYGTGIALSVTANGYGVLCCGRAIYGLGIALAMHGGPSFIAETSPRSLRGLFISAKEALIVAGILLGYFFSFLLVDVEGGWRWNYGLTAPLILLFGISSAWLPESPRYLILQDKLAAAKTALLSVFGRIPNRDEAAEREMALMLSVTGEERQTSGGLFQERNWRPLYITLSLVCLQQATGQPSVLYYAQEIFEKAHIFSDSSDASGAAVVMGVWKLLWTAAAASRVEEIGRRPLLIYGVTGLTAALFLLSLCTLLEDRVDAVRSLAAWGSVVALFLYVGCYQFSFGPITWLLVGELYPLDVRTEGIAVCTFSNFGTNFVVSLLFPVLSDTIGLSAEYLLFALMGVGSIALIAARVPETKGKSLEEIERLMRT